MPVINSIGAFFKVKHSLRGCVRHLHLNSRPVDMAETDVISNVEHCYANIEPGVGFTGQTLGVYG